MQNAVIVDAVAFLALRSRRATGVVQVDQAVAIVVRAIGAAGALGGPLDRREAPWISTVDQLVAVRQYHRTPVDHEMGAQPPCTR